MILYLKNVNLINPIIAGPLQFKIINKIKQYNLKKISFILILMKHSYKET